MLIHFNNTVHLLHVNIKLMKIIFQGRKCGFSFLQMFHCCHEREQALFSLLFLHLVCCYITCHVSSGRSALYSREIACYKNKFYVSAIKSSYMILRSTLETVPVQLKNINCPNNTCQRVLLFLTVHNI